MRKRGKIFKSFKEVTINEVVDALKAINANLKLVLELLADLRVNTSEDPKKAAKEEKEEK